ncbi:MAG: AsmA family protein [Bacteroidales bacterium]|nr:AsmA family protein [Bacteroidales bacterium]
MNKLQSFLKKTLKAVLWVAIVIILIVVIIAALIQIPGIQNKIVHYATSFVSNKTHTRVEIKNISISFPKSVVIEGLYLEDAQKDTLLYAGKAKINIAPYDLFSDKISISSFALEDVNLNLYSTDIDSLFNYNFLLTAFSDTTNQTKVKPQSTSKWTFSIDKASLKNIRLHYDDEYGGMNVAVVLGSLKLKMDEIDFGKSIYGIYELLIESLNANVLIKKPAIANNKKSDSVLPKITVNKIQIINSTVSYGDSISKQSVI